MTPALLDTDTFIDLLRYIDFQHRNMLLPNADLLVAATALVHDLTLATSNERHFVRIATLRLVDWREAFVG